ncbi:MAG: hypothetical protein NUV49_00645 [Patescibacteria group bacterium]|nr:hypothetical protein [Patescibacteria group bacterium]
MEHKQNTQETIISVVFIILLLLFLNPFGFWMPGMLLYMMIAGLVVSFALFASFIWKEQARDEREQLHKMIAGRVGYLSGIAVLVLGVVVESITSHVDPWLIAVLGAMIIGKAVGHIYGQSRN